ncbi:MAG: oxygenase MpaB family protein [Rhodospirillales bacterium]|nr:oxygenase MpaB family protein [Rhodospirillales bacterium]
MPRRGWTRGRLACKPAESGTLGAVTKAALPATDGAPFAEAGRTPISHRVNREAVVVLGWGRAILLQLAHPLVAAGVGAHSGFDAGALAYVRRMRRTIGAMLSLTFGTESEIRETVDRINAIHRRVHGRLDRAVGGYPAGTAFDATDPALLTWVHATLIDSQLRTYALFVGTLARNEEDRYCAEAARVGPLLGVSASELPDTRHRLDRYLDRMQQDDRLAVGDAARRLAGALLAPPGRRWVAPALWLGRLTTVGLLPEPIRGAYGFPWRAKDARRLRSAAAVLRAARRVTPPLLREWPAARRSHLGLRGSTAAGGARRFPER